MKGTLIFRGWERVVRFVEDLPSLVADASQLTVTIKPSDLEDCFAVSVTEDSSFTSPPSGSEPQQSTLKSRPSVPNHP